MPSVIQQFYQFGKIAFNRAAFGMVIHGYNLVIGFFRIAMAAAIFLLPTAANAEGTKLKTPSIIIEYGENLEDVDFVAEDLETLGIQVTLQAGYTNPSCGRVTINGMSQEFDQDKLDGGDVGSYIHRSVQGKKSYYEAPSCEAGADNHTE